MLDQIELWQCFVVGNIRVWDVVSVLLEALLMLFEGHDSSLLSWFSYC